MTSGGGSFSFNWTLPADFAYRLEQLRRKIQAPTPQAVVWQALHDYGQEHGVPVPQLLEHHESPSVSEKVVALNTKRLEPRKSGELVIYLEFPSSSHEDWLKDLQEKTSAPRWTKVITDALNWYDRRILPD